MAEISDRIAATKPDGLMERKASPTLRKELIRTGLFRICLMNEEKADSSSDIRFIIVRQKVNIIRLCATETSAA